MKTAIDLFAGAGGGGLGIVQAGFDLRMAVEMDQFAAETHRRHLLGLLVEQDLRELTDQAVLDSSGLAVGELDLLFAGPPCQGFSMIGPRQISDLRNSLFREVLRVAAAARPRAVVIENVPGLVSLAGGSYLAGIMSGLTDLGYDVACAELLAAQYGTPQMRWRLVIVAWRRELGIPAGYGFPLPSHGGLGIGELISNVTVPAAAYRGFVNTRHAIGDLPTIEAGEFKDSYDGVPRVAYQRAARTHRGGETMDPSVLHDHYAAALGEQTLTRLRHLSPGQDWRDLPFDLLPDSMKRAHRKDHTRRFRRMTWDGIPRAVITRFRDPKSGEYTHPEQHRTISIREAARIQGFPDWFSFAGSNTSKYTQVGNAIPVPLARAVAQEVLACLEGNPQAPRLSDPFGRRPVALLGHHGELSTTLVA